MIIKNSAVVLILGMTVLTTLARAESYAQVCATVEADSGRCKVKLLNPAAVDELPRMVVSECQPGTHLTIEAPSSRLYQQLVSVLCRPGGTSTAAANVFSCVLRGTR